MWLVGGVQECIDNKYIIEGPHVESQKLSSSECSKIKKPYCSYAQSIELAVQQCNSVKLT